MDLEQEIANFGVVPRGAPLPAFHAALTNVFGPEGHFLELFFGHVAEHAPVLDEGEIPEGVGWINQVLYQLTWPEYAETRLALTWQMLRPVTTLLENYGMTLIDQMPKQSLERETTMLGELARMFPGTLPISRAASHLNSGDLRLMNLLWLTWPNYDFNKDYPWFGRVYDNSWMRYLELLSRSIHNVERPETAILFTNLFYRNGIVALEDYFISKLAAIQDEDAPPSFRRLGELIQAEIGAYREKVLENLNAAQHPNAVEHVARAAKVYEARVTDAIRAIGNLPRYLQGTDERLVALLLDNAPELDPIDQNLLGIGIDCRKLGSLAEKGRLPQETIELMQGIRRFARRSNFIHYAVSSGWEGDTLRVVQQAITEGASHDEIMERARGIGFKRARKQPYTAPPPESRALQSNRIGRKIANLVPPSGKADIEFIAEHPELRTLLTKMSEESGESLPELSLWATSEHALEHLLGSQGFNKLLGQLIRQLREDRKTLVHLLWVRDGVLGVVPEDALAYFEKDRSWIVHDHRVGTYCSKPGFIVHLEGEPRHRLDPSFFVKLYPVECVEELKVELDNSNYFFENVLPIVISNEKITARDGRAYLALIWPAISGDCAYRRLNGWEGEHRAVLSQHEKRAYFCEAIDMLVGIHFRGKRAPWLKPVKQGYFIDRIQGIFFGMLSKELGIDVSAQAGFLEEYARVEEHLALLTGRFGRFYKDASPTNDIITPRDVFPVDFEHNRIVYRGIDLVSKLEAGWDFPSDEVLSSERREYLSRVEKENLIDRYLLMTGPHEIHERVFDKNYDFEDYNSISQADEATNEVLREAGYRIEEPSVYASHPLFSRIVSTEEREAAFRDYWGAARLQRHLEFAGYSALVIRKGLNEGNQKLVMIGARRLVYHAGEALDASYRMAEASKDYQEMYTAFERFVAEHCTLKAVRAAISKIAPSLQQ